MKRYLLLCAMMTQFIYAASIADQAVQLYQQGEYQEIIDRYDQQKNSGAIWCLMGNAAYCLQKYTHAYLYWLRAQCYGNADTYDISVKNIRLLESQGFVPAEHKVYTWFIWLSKYVGICILQIILLLVWYVLCLLLYNKNKSCIALGGLVLLSCCLMGPIIAAYYFDQKTAVVMEDATIYNGPNRAYYTIGSVPKGALVKVESMQSDWIKIIYNDTIGWIGRTHVGLLEIHELEVTASRADALQ